jgi:hypothetical protein
MTHLPEEGRIFLASTPRFYWVMREDLYDELKRSGADLPIVYRRDGLRARSGRSRQRTRGR